MLVCNISLELQYLLFQTIKTHYGKQLSTVLSLITLYLQYRQISALTALIGEEKNWHAYKETKRKVFIDLNEGKFQ